VLTAPLVLGLAEVLSSLPACPAGRASCIALDLWVAESRLSKIAWVRSQLEAANEKLAVIDAGVQVIAVHALPESDLDVLDAAARDRLGRHGEQAPLRWFVVDRLVDLEEHGRERRGVTWRRAGGFYVIEALSAWAPTLAHELGHVLGLPHSTEAASLMNKSVRAWPPFWKWGFTARERPRMKKTLARLIGEHQLTRVAR
jgi:hypothetical protein